MRFPKCCFLLVLLAGCASTPSGSVGDNPSESGASTAAPSAPAVEKKAAAKPREKGETGLLDVSVIDVGGRSLPARVELQDAAGVVEDRYEAPQGKSQFQPSLGGFRAFVYVYDNKVPILVHVEDVLISKEKPAAISVDTFR